LVDDRVARGDGRGDLAREHVEREVPRADDADDPERLAAVEADYVATDRQRAPLESAHGAGVIADAVDRGVDVGVALAPGLAAVRGLQPGEALGVGLEPVRDLEQKRLALARPDPGPAGP